MNERVNFWTGIIVATLFSVASILGGFQFDNYNPLSQYISETYAIDTPFRILYERMDLKNRLDE